jgi:hypothetical protein
MGAKDSTIMTKGRRVIRFSQLADAIRDAEQLLSRGHHTVGRWSLAQICNHLSSSIGYTVDGFPGKTAPWIVRQTLGRAVRTLMISTGRIMEGAPLPENFKPLPTLDPTHEVNTLRLEIERFEASQGDCKPHPFLGRMSRNAWERFHCVHCAHHLSFALPA